MKQWVCPACGYVHNGDVPPEKCPVCGVAGEKFKEQLAAAGKTDNNGNAYTEATNISATDFVGGLHGDENMEFVEFYID